MHSARAADPLTVPAHVPEAAVAVRTPGAETSRVVRVSASTMAPLPRSAQRTHDADAPHAAGRVATALHRALPASVPEV